MESFFLEALEQVREEVHKERNRPPPAGPERSNRDLGAGGANVFLTGVNEEVCVCVCARARVRVHARVTCSRAYAHALGLSFASHRRISKVNCQQSSRRAGEEV